MAVALTLLSTSVDPPSPRIWSVVALLAVRLEPPRTSQLSCAVLSPIVFELPFSTTDNASAQGLINSMGAKVASLSIRASGEIEKVWLTCMVSLLILSAKGNFLAAFQIVVLKGRESYKTSCERYVGLI